MSRRILLPTAVFVIALLALTGFTATFAARPTQTSSLPPLQVQTNPVVLRPVHSDTSPPLRDITPAPPSSASTPAEGDSFVPGGQGWDSSTVKDGDYVVLFGHPAGPGEPSEMCPGGRAYIVDRMQPNQ